MDQTKLYIVQYCHDHHDFLNYTKTEITPTMQISTISKRQSVKTMRQHLSILCT
ncbi:hypothetical protein AAKU64_001546 [Undibacterium sp. GrIS 1.8]